MNKKMFFLSLGLFFSLMSQAQTAEEYTAMSVNATDMVKPMFPGWNLGNTLEAGNSADLYKNDGVGTETWWQSTKTTQEIIDYVKAQGFKSIRIPCAWIMGHVSESSSYTIDAKWMARVKEIVDYCIKDGLFVIINQHWDGGWLQDHIVDTDAATIAKNKVILTAVWKQIANEFKGYDEHLLFAGLNEPSVGDVYKTTVAQRTAATTQLVGYEQVFIDVVRATGGNNAKRILIVQGPNTDVDMTYDLMNTLPTDATSKRLMVEVHYYSPWNFAGMTQDESYGKMFNYWGAANHVTGSSHNATWGEETYLKQQLTKMKTKFVDKDIPVIIGEYGANWKSVSGTGEKQSNHDASIKLYYQLINQYSAELGGMVPFAWDTNYIGHPCMTLINRSAKSIYVTPAMEGINAAVLAADIDVKKMTETNMDKDNVVACTYYDLQGRRLAKPTQGLYLARKTFLDGSVKTSMMAEE